MQHGGHGATGSDVAHRTRDQMWYDDMGYQWLDNQLCSVSKLTSASKKKRKRKRRECGTRRRVMRLSLKGQQVLCFYCQLDLVKNIKEASYDHKVALSEGGSNRQENKVFACKSCNGKKGRMTVEQFLETLKVL